MISTGSHNHIWPLVLSVLVYSGCHNKITQSGQLKEKEFSQKVQGQGEKAWLVPGESSLPGLQYCRVAVSSYGKEKKRASVLKSLPLSFKFFKDLFTFRERRREGERERNISVWLPLTYPLRGTRPATQACTLTGNRTSDPLIHRPALSQLSHTSQASSLLF